MNIKTKGNIAKVLAIASLATTLAPAATFAAPTGDATSTGDTTPSGGEVVTPAKKEVKFTWNLYNGDKEVTPAIKKDAVETSLKGLVLKVAKDGATTPTTVFEVGNKTETKHAENVYTIAAEKDGKTTIDGKEYKVELKVTLEEANAKVSVVMKELTTDGKETDTKIITTDKIFQYGTTAPVVEDTKITPAEKKLAEDFIGAIVVKAEQGKVIGTVPKAPAGLKATVTLTNTTDKTAQDVVVEAGELAKAVEVGKLANKTSVTVKIAVTRPDGKAVANGEKTFGIDLSKSAPVVNYAYVIDGALVINSTADAGMAKTPLFWKYSYEKDFRAISPDLGYGFSYRSSEVNNEKKANFDSLFGKTTYNKYDRLNANDYRIPIEIPCKIQIVFVDALGNKTPVALTINEDNVILKGTGIGEAPEYVGKLIKSVTDGGTFESAREKDLLVIKKDTTVNLYETFKSLLQKEWDSFNSRELNWTCDQFNNFDAYRIKFNKEGRFEFEVTKDGSKGKVTFTVLVMDGKNNIKSFKVLKDVKVNGEKFQAIKGFEFKTTDGKDANPTGFYAKYDGKYYRLTDEIPFATAKNKDAKEAVVIVKDVQNNKNYEIKFIQASATKIPLEKARTMFSDLKGHWAENRVVTLVANGVISGYPDGTFKPNNMISARETLAIIGRFGQTLNKEKVSAVVNDKVEFAKANWGNEDVEWVLKRLPQNIFVGQNLDQQLTREQVAYVMNHVFKYGTASATTSLTDIGTAKYQTEINQLVAAGTIKGYPDGTFKPNLPITRAELCSMMFVIPGVQYEVIAQGTSTPANNTSTNKAPANKENTEKISSLNDLFK